jgi:hypothetical protein
MIVGAEPCARAERVLRAMAIERKQALFPFVRWDKVTDYYSMVITPDSEPSSRYDPSICPAISLVAIVSRIRAKKLRSPKVLWDTCRDRKWQAEHIADISIFQPVKVGDVTYEIPLVLDPAELKKMGIKVGGLA